MIAGGSSMRKLVLGAAALFVAMSSPAAAGTECTLFSIDAKCSKSGKPGLVVTFGGPSLPAAAPVAKKKPEQPRAAVVSHTTDTAAIDCRMVHQPAGGTHFASRVIAPHPAIKHPMRTVIVPACEK
jgi:hypothetical protein